MSISPPSDIVLDVAQAADPTRLQAATAKLGRAAAGLPATDSFFESLSSAAKQRSRVGASTGSTLPFASSGPGRATALSPYQKFEAVVLQNFVQNVLPKDEGLFGDAASADITRSLLAEQVANQIAKSGKLGIARLIEAARAPGKAEKPEATPSPGPPAAAAAPAAGPLATAALTPARSGIKGPDRLTQ
ncbi:MAG: rod-binding protein [Parafilimonas terrae]|nr:rod-binding protein [Parafilimonas terrae]